MKKIAQYLIGFVYLLLPMAALAQTHSVALASQPSTTTGVSSYNVYRAPCTTVTGTLCSAGEGTFAKIGTATIGATITYTDTTVLGGSNYSYYFTAACPTAGCGTDANGNKITGESAGSNHVGVSIPANAPLPPGNLAITSVARNTNPDGSTQIIAKWEGVPNTKMTYTFYGAGKVLTTGSLTNTSGVYQATLTTGLVKPGQAVSIEICTVSGECSSKLL